MRTFSQLCSEEANPASGESTPGRSTTWRIFVLRCLRRRYNLVTSLTLSIRLRNPRRQFSMCGRVSRSERSCSVSRLRHECGLGVARTLQRQLYM